MKLHRSKASAPAMHLELPERAANVILSTAAGGQIPARVVERESNSVLVAVAVPIRPFTAAQLDDLVLEFHSARGRIRLRGTFVVEDPSDPDLLRMLEPRSIEISQQRNYVRIQAARPVIVYGSGNAGQHQSFTVDLSGGGFLLAGPDTLPIGEEITFRITLTAGVLPITGMGRVVRVDRHGRRAVSFEKISDLDRRRLVRFIFEVQRNERQRGVNGDRNGG
jgi:hypothetical protein